jgi:ADP-heptose:LPS heptosyltransferase
MDIVLVGAKNEVSFAQEIVKAVETRVTNLTGQTSLRDLIGIFSRAQFALGPDSGPMHIAAATGIPVISLWGAMARSAQRRGDRKHSCYKEGQHAALAMFASALSSDGACNTLRRSRC